ncbi:MAG: hypothetical protein BRD51_03855 [Bacteroidetes bacterium SW_11_64_17]|nr:MAG: hypothetical protein BRD51_03855 [Bacteroidetes bacterium SW_11_64_17]
MLSTVLCALLLAGCSVVGDDETSASGPLRAELVNEAVAVQNRGQDTVWTFMAGQHILARLDWRPSLDPDGLAPGSTRTVALEKIPMGDDEDRVVVFWWSARVNAGTREPGEVSSLSVEI